MKTDVHKRWWFIAVCLLIGIIGFRHFWLWLPEHRYTSMITSKDLLAALEANDSQHLARFATNHGYRYQVFEGQRLQSTNDSSLPRPKLLHQSPPASGVIASSLKDQLRSTRPYILQQSLHRYVFFATTKANTTYIVYGRVL